MCVFKADDFGSKNLPKKYFNREAQCRDEEKKAVTCSKLQIDKKVCVLVRVCVRAREVSSNFDVQKIPEDRVKKS